MVFNWFRRKYNNDESATPQAEEQKTSTPIQESPAESTQATSQEQPTPDAALDYLSFAKAAYKNIQQRQQAQVSEVGETEGAEGATDIEATVEPAELPVVEATVSETDESTVSPIEAASAETATTPIPFWARAEADRQARIEKLKETAIELPEPEVVPAASTTTDVTESEATAIPNLAFDEGFLWSTEILAAQGRRPQDVSIEEITWLKKLRQGLDKTRRNIVNQLKAIVGQGPLNQAAVMEIESLLLQADVGVEATDYIITALQNQLRKEALPPDAAIAYLKKILQEMLDRPLQSHNAIFAPEKDTLNIWLITGVNGAGKTTTIGKIAHISQKSGYNCLIAAADTFRAAAVEQVKVWGARSGIEVIANPGKNTDPAAVVFDAIAAASSRGTELLLIDTAGRLQNKKNLMDELSKIRRIIDKKAANAKVESLLVLDATLGQNGLRQAEVFAQAAQLSGVVLTKLDGTAKGGVALAVVQQLNLPIRFIGAGEGIEDLRPFSSYEFVEALLST
ncbi:MAG TPA: signal recognition particle-docking protein FtsY [Cyanobacteria bacterium UBA11049]|nr:signal recognition particle-docking protein FtsY [Cyanobacteria bacterium UBA11049]